MVTHEQLLEAADYIPETAGGLILGGEQWHCDVPVFNPEDHGLEVEIGDGARRRHPKRTELDLFVLHWTGGERNPPGLFETLEARELGVEFAIGHFGDVWQYADPLLVDTFDAGKVNPRSMGVEIVNYGFRGKGRKPPGRWGKSRDLYETKLNGRKRTFARFRPAQINSAVALLEAVIASETTLIERRIPRDGAGVFMARQMARAELRAFNGVLGHFHVSGRKSDPGTDIFDALDACGF